MVGGASGAGWSLTLCPAAAEAGGSFRYSLPRPYVHREGPAADAERARMEAARRARGQVRRYCAGNRLNRLGTLTYGGAGCHDPKRLREHVGVFFRQLRAGFDGEPLPYLWVPEWHSSGHGLHVHFAVGRFVPRGLIERAWGRGFVHIKLLGNLPVGSGPLAEARVAARYLGKYVGKSFEHAATPGLHRYEVAQGFHPAKKRLTGRSWEQVIDLASDRLGARPQTIWHSKDAEDWKGPPSVWAQWPG